jgi:hypothetical protein
VSEFSEYVTEGMSAENAIANLKKEINELEQSGRDENDKHTQEIKSLNEKISSMIDATVKGPKLVVDGLEREVDKGIASESMILYKDRPYYSEGLVNPALAGVFSYAADKETIFYNSNGQVSQEETKVNLFELEDKVLYDGIRMEKLLPTDGKFFSIGGEKYNEGFALVNSFNINHMMHEFLDEKRFYSWDLERGPEDREGYALFNLNSKYTTLSFDVGRETSDGEKQDASLKVYLDGVLTGSEYSLSANETIKHIDIPLNSAKSLKISLSGGNAVRYAFVNCVLTR